MIVELDVVSMELNVSMALIGVTALVFLALRDPTAEYLLVPVRRCRALTNRPALTSESQISNAFALMVDLENYAINLTELPSVPYQLTGVCGLVNINLTGPSGDTTATLATAVTAASLALRFGAAHKTVSLR